MSAYRRGRRWWFRLYNSRGESEPRTTGTTDKGLARDVERMCDALRAQRKHVVLDALWNRDLGLGVALDHWAAGTIDQLAAALVDRDLSALVPDWERSLRARFPKARGHAGTPARYAVHLAAFVAERGDGGRLYASRFTTPAVDAFTAALGAAPATVARYLAALSSFGTYAERRGWLARNPVQGAAWPRERDLTRRTRHLTFREQMRLIDAAPPGSALQLTLVLAHLGLEWGAIYALRKADLDLARRQGHAKGTKTLTRDRAFRVEAWAVPYLERALKHALPDARVVEAGGDGAGHPDGTTMGRRIKRLCAALGVEDYHLHDARHTYAVRHYAAGVSPEAVGRQLGHKDGSEVVARYGRFKPTDDDLARYEAMAAARDADHDTREAK